MNHLLRSVGLKPPTKKPIPVALLLNEYEMKPKEMAALNQFSAVSYVDQLRKLRGEAA